MEADYKAKIENLEAQLKEAADGKGLQYQDREG